MKLIRKKLRKSPIWMQFFRESEWSLVLLKPARAELCPAYYLSSDFFKI